MEQLLITVFNSLHGSGRASFLISLIALILGAWLYFRKTNVEQITGVGSLQQKQITSLMEQIGFLSAELTKARTQLSEIHEQNIHLMLQVRESNKRIQELEVLLGTHKE